MENDFLYLANITSKFFGKPIQRIKVKRTSPQNYCITIDGEFFINVAEEVIRSKYRDKLIKDIFYGEFYAKEQPKRRLPPLTSAELDLIRGQADRLQEKLRPDQG